MNGFRPHSEDRVKRIKQCSLAIKWAISLNSQHENQELIKNMAILQAQVMYKTHNNTYKNHVTFYIHNANGLFMSQEQISLNAQFVLQSYALFISEVGQKTTAHKTNMACCMFSCGPQAKNVFYIFK